MELTQLLTKVALSSPWEAYLQGAFLSSDQQARGTCQVRASFVSKNSWEKGDLGYKYFGVSFID